MEELSKALQGALDMSSSNCQQTENVSHCQHAKIHSSRLSKRQQRRRRNRKRRLDPNPIWEYAVKFSEDSDSTLDEALKDYMENVEAQAKEQSDSAGEDSVMKRLSSLNVTSSSNLYGESDSFGENPNCKKRAIRKKKSRPKRMAIDGVTGSCSFQDFVPMSSCTKQRPRKSRKKNEVSDENNVNSDVNSAVDKFIFDSGTLKSRKGRDKISNKLLDLDPDYKHLASSPEGADSSKSSQNNEIQSSGSRTRSSSSDGTMCTKTDDCKDKESLSSDTTMEGRANESSGEENGSISSGVEEGLFTNDEGREGDDEQSDFFHEAGGSVSGVPQIIPWWEKDYDKMDDQNRFNGILNGTFSLLSKVSQRNFSSRLRSLQKGEDCSLRNRSRFKSKRLRRPPVSILNENVVQFLRNPHEKEHHLQAMKRREPIGQAASIYSLDFTTKHRNRKSDRLCNKSKKQHSTGSTTCDIHMVSSSAESELRLHSNSQGANAKRRKKSAPIQITVTKGAVGKDADPIPESNVGNKILQNMGWKPGTGLGSVGQGIKDPVQAFIRPKNRGLGHWKPT